MGSRPGHKPIPIPDMAPILADIREGKTYREIASGLGISAPLLCEWLARPEVSEHSARALTDSAEAWLDRGFHELLKSNPETATRARYIEQACARRAGIRNMHYRERVGLDAKVSGGVTIELVNFANTDTDTK